MSNIRIFCLAVTSPHTRYGYGYTYESRYVHSGHSVGSRRTESEITLWHIQFEKKLWIRFRVLQTLLSNVFTQRKTFCSLLWLLASPLHIKLASDY